MLYKPFIKQFATFCKDAADVYEPQQLVYKTLLTVKSLLAKLKLNWLFIINGWYNMLPSTRVVVLFVPKQTQEAPDCNACAGVHAQGYVFSHFKREITFNDTQKYEGYTCWTSGDKLWHWGLKRTGGDYKKFPSHTLKRAGLRSETIVVNVTWVQQWLNLYYPAVI